MKRSTCKEVKEAIRQYILENIELDNYEVDESTLTPSQKIIAVFNVFKLEKGWQIQRDGMRIAFLDWLQGVPSAIHTDIYYCEQRSVLESWLEQEPDESSRYCDIDVATHYYNLLYREFFAMVRLAECNRL